MKVRSIYSVLDILKPYNVDHCFFRVDGFDGNFDICSYKAMRGYYGLKDGEEEGQYYITHFGPNGLMITIVCKPGSNQFEITDNNRKKKKLIENYEAWKSHVVAALTNWCVQM